jgi:hypothetical protein
MMLDRDAGRLGGGDQRRGNRAWYVGGYQQGGRGDFGGGGQPRHQPAARDVQQVGGDAVAEHHHPHAQWQLQRAQRIDYRGAAADQHDGG